MKALKIVGFGLGLALIIGLVAAAQFKFTQMVVHSERSAQQSFGSIQTVAGIPYYLYGSGIGASQTTLTLTSFRVPVSAYTLVMSDFGSIGYLTLEPGNTTRQEFISFTGVTQNSDGTATLTGLTRGLSPVSPYTASTTIQKSHGGGTVAIISNPPQLYEQFLSKYNIGTSSAVSIFGSTTPPRYDSPGLQSSGTYNATTSEFVSWAGLTAVSNSGTVNATEVVKGISELATAAESASSTILGSTVAGLVMQSRYATDTPQSKCNSLGSAAGASCSVIADLGGHLKQAWIDLTQAFTVSGAWIFNGSSTHNATTTIAGSNVLSNAFVINTLPYKFPAIRAASSTALMEDGSGNLSWEPSHQIYSGVATAQITATNAYATTSALLTIPAGLLNASSTIEVAGAGECDRAANTGANCTFYLRDSTGATFVSAGADSQSTASGSNSVGTFFFKVFFNNSLSSQTSVITASINGISNSGGIATLNGLRGGSDSTSAVNMANATTLYVVIRSASTDATAKANDISVVVHQ